MRKNSALVIRALFAVFHLTTVALAVQGPPTPEEQKDEVSLWLDEKPDQTWKVVGQYPAVPGTVHGKVLDADAATGSYNHHARIIFHDGKFHATWSNQRYDEDGPGQRILYAVSADGLTWSAPRELVPALAPEGPWELGGIYCSAGEFVVWEGRIFGSGGVAEMTGWKNMEKTKDSRVCTKECPFPVYASRGRVFREIKPDGTFGKLFAADRSKLPAETLFPVAKREDIERSFRLPPREWVEGDAISQKPERRLCEPTVWKTRKGWFTMLLRDDSNSYRKWVAFSDDGRSWTKPCLTDISDSRSLSCNITLEDGTVLLITNPRGRGFSDPVLGWRDRDPLTISVSRDGLRFGATHTVKEGYHTYEVSPGPRCRGGSAQYPCAIVREGYCYVIYSNGKEDIETTRILLAPLLAAAEKLPR